MKDCFGPTDLIENICYNHYNDLMQYPNVVGVGKSYKVTDNTQTFAHCICVMVTKKQPVEELNPEDIVPKYYKTVVTDVVEIGEIFASAFVGKVRPMQFGYSIGILGVNSAGTAGCKVKSKTSASTVYILSNNHVLANINSAPIGSSIIQPSQIDGGRSTDVVARLTSYIPVQFQTVTTKPINTVDCAIAQLVSTTIASSQIAAIGIPRGTAAAFINQKVQKSGRTTSYTTGVVKAIGATVSVNYGGGRTALFTNQIITTYMSAAGDSGSLLLDTSNRAVGLLFAGSTSATIYNPIGLVLQALNVDLVTS